MCYSALVRQDLKFLKEKLGAILVREQYEEYQFYSQKDPKKYPQVAERIYPGHFAPVVFNSGLERKIELMRYGTFVPQKFSQQKNYTSFNARSDNLSSSFWENAFLKHHGIIVLDGFYEWVAVSDLLKAGHVSIKNVKAEFERQAAERKSKVEALGKKYKPTPTELKDPRFRRIIIEFKPESGEDLIVPVIFSLDEPSSQPRMKGFAIITDEPTPEIKAAGHDRCPLFLEKSMITSWLDAEALSAQDASKILKKSRDVTFIHSLPSAA